MEYGLVFFVNDVAVKSLVFSPFYIYIYLYNCACIYRYRYIHIYTPIFTPLSLFFYILP